MFEGVPSAPLAPQEDCFYNTKNLTSCWFKENAHSIIRPYTEPFQISKMELFPFFAKTSRCLTGF